MMISGSKAADFLFLHTEGTCLPILNAMLIPGCILLFASFTGSTLLTDCAVKSLFSRVMCFAPIVVTVCSLPSTNGNSSSWSSLGLEGEAYEEHISFSPSDRLVRTVFVL